jgi:hypothetical protein
VNVVLLSSARRTTTDAALSVRSQLGLTGRPEVVLDLVALHRPGRPLPGMRCIVLTPRVIAGRRAVAVPAAPLPADDLAAPVSGDPSVRQAEPGTPPRREGFARVAHGVRWRARRARATAGAHPAVLRISSSTKVRKVRSALRPLDRSSGYAVAALVSREVHSLVADADVVVALDAHTFRAAWLLARRHPGPAVVVGAAAGKRAAALRG